MRGVPHKSNHRPGRKGLFQTRRPLPQRSLLMTPLREQRGKNERAERRCQDARLCAHDAVFDWKFGITEISDAKSCRPHDRQCNDERGRRGEYRPATGR